MWGKLNECCCGSGVVRGAIWGWRWEYGPESWCAGRPNAEEGLAGADARACMCLCLCGEAAAQWSISALRPRPQVCALCFPLQAGQTSCEVRPFLARSDVSDASHW